MTLEGGAGRRICFRSRRKRRSRRQKRNEAREEKGEEGEEGLENGRLLRGEAKETLRKVDGWLHLRDFGEPRRT